MPDDTFQGGAADCADLGAEAKRAAEWWFADAAFRDEVRRDPRGAAARRGLKVDPAELLPLLERRPADGRLSPAGQAYAAVRAEGMELGRRIFVESTPADPRLRAWRTRQMRRVELECEPVINDAIPHLPFAIELSKGCSGGCWFCGANAGKLEAVWPHTPANVDLFRGVLGELGRLAGPAAARWGFLYWGTDPFDNPDYERFCEDFADLFGAYPHTTTVQALRDPERTRRFLRRSVERGCRANRFSVLSLGALSRLHTLFSAEELKYVGLVPQMPTSLLPKIDAGRARARRQRIEAQEERPAMESDGDSGACVSGFLLNMVERRVALIAPCATSDRWPSGYQVFDEGRFDSVPDFARALEDIIGRHMPPAIMPSHHVRFVPSLTWEPLDEGFLVRGPYGSREFRGTAALADLPPLLEGGGRTVAEVANYYRARYIFEPDYVFDWLDLLREGGVLEQIADN